MLNSIEFDYETLEGDMITVYGSTDGSKVDFKAFDVVEHKRISKSRLSSIDIRNIEDLILDIIEPDIEYESDFYDRSSD